MSVNVKSLRGQEQGMGHVLVVALIVVVVAVVGFAGYEVSMKNKPKASTNTTTTTTSSEQVAADAGCVATYHDANLCKFANNANIDKQVYKATLTVTNAQGVSNMTLESDGKGNTSSTISGSGETMGTVELDGNSYIQTGQGGTWYEYPAGSSSDTSSATSNPTSGMNLVLGANITYKPEGTAACGSMTCYKYEVTDKTTPTTTQTVWFDTQHYLLREWKATDTSSNETTDMQLSYPSSVTITKPSPVQVFGQ